MDLGFADDDPALLLNHWKFYLRAVTNAIIDVGIHTEGMTEDEAVSLMVDGGFQEEAEARAKYDRARLSSTQLVHVLRRVDRRCGTSSATGGGRLAAASGDPRGADAVPEPRVVGGFGETPGFDYRAHLEDVHLPRLPADLLAPPARPRRASGRASAGDAVSWQAPVRGRGPDRRDRAAVRRRRGRAGRCDGLDVRLDARPPLIERGRDVDGSRPSGAFENARRRPPHVVHAEERPDVVVCEPRGSRVGRVAPATVGRGRAPADRGPRRVDELRPAIAAEELVPSQSWTRGRPDVVVGEPGVASAVRTCGIGARSRAA